MVGVRHVGGVVVTRRIGHSVPSQRILAVVSAALLVVAHLGLAVGWSVERLRRVLSMLAGVFLTVVSGSRTADRTSIPDIGRTVEMTAHAAPWPLAGKLTCLRVALVAHVLYEQFGVDADIRFGVMRKSGVFEAHAWVECDGAVVTGDVSNLDAYAVLEGKQGVRAVR
ncbi:hypothetical protein C499_19147 [Halogeometricum borinquense DSM 11551]|uniref:Microcin J25-processing protein McjB C-terminal domain-containing protein n=2 Tax=Halogeometricum borinquense TaxID=60847 RepID=E4NTI3_HALBP|nr:hypothetical protein Hbor_03230 [Halogeometricum borinquense DSM 11551]ELY23084.1 hypothetical protein C499_19147 [Halogeometricum borinquense DSM 11551]RYJ14177.1 lasso peptide biosynthesis B2 protein [Halogeometricum borinquense]